MQLVKPIQVTFVNVGAIAFGPNPAGLVIGSEIQRAAPAGGVECRYLDFVLYKDGLDKMLWRIIDADSHVVVFSVYSWNVAAVSKLVAALKTMIPHASLIAGGAGVDLLADAVRGCFDLTTNQDGERTVSEWLGYDASSGDSFFAATSPYSDRPDNYVTSFHDKTVICYDAARGCSFKCSFCLDGDPSRPEKRRPLDVIERDLKFLADSRYRLIDVADNNANLDPNAFATYLDFARKHPKVGIHLEARPEAFSEDSCMAAATLPNLQMFLGIQSFNPSENERVKRRNSPKKIGRVLRSWLGARNRRACVGVDLIFGLPGQSRASFETSFDQTAGFAVNKINLNQYLMFRPTDQDASTLGVLDDDYNRAVVRTPEISTMDMLWFRRFKRTHIKIQECGHLTTVLSALVLAEKQSPADFYTNIAEQVSLRSSRKQILDLVDQESRRRLCPQNLSIYREAMCAATAKKIPTNYCLFFPGEDWALSAVRHALPQT